MTEPVVARRSLFGAAPATHSGCGELPWPLSCESVSGGELDFAAWGASAIGALNCIDSTMIEPSLGELPLHVG